MPESARKGDIGSDHEKCFPSSPAIEGSGDVFINGLPAVRQGDAYAAHGCVVCASHERYAAQGSATVNINGRPAVRVGDAIDCGGVALTGSVGRVRKQEPYKLYKNGGLVQQGLTDDEGLIHYEYELPLNAAQYEIEVENQRFAIDIRALVPPETDQGVKQRLAALGYNCFDDTDPSALNVPAGNPDEADVRWVQCDDEDAASGAITGQTTSKVKGLMP